MGKDVLADVMGLLARARNGEADVVELLDALADSVGLQSHYASLLNQYDGGERMTFPSVESWLVRRRELDRCSADADEGGSGG